MKTTIATMLILALLLVGLSHADDWPQWRGPERNNASAEENLLRQWPEQGRPEQGPPLLYQIDGLGEGITSLAIAGDQAFTISGFRGQEYVVAFDNRTGHRQWLSPLGPISDWIPAARLMRWLSQRSPTVTNEAVYAVSSAGAIISLARDTGKQNWFKDYQNDYGVTRQTWGYCDYPLVDGEHLICVPGGSEATVVALQRQTGREVWRTLLGEKDASSNQSLHDRSAHSATIHGKSNEIEFYVVITSRAVNLIAKQDGRLLDRYEKTSSTIANTHTPLLAGDDLIVTNGYGGGFARLSIEREGSDLKFVERFHQPIPLNPFQDHGALVGEMLFHTSRQDRLTRIDARTGTPLATRRLRGRQGMTFADGRLYCLSSFGQMTLLDAESDDLAIVGEWRLPEIPDAMGVTLPVVSQGKLFVRRDEQLFCFDVSREAVGLDSVPVVVKHDPPDLDTDGVEQQLPIPIYVPTPQDVVEKMLQQANLQPGKRLVDLGSGDGRIVITAAKIYRAHAIGFEIDQSLVDESQAKIVQAGLSQLASIKAKDMYQADLSRTDVLTLYVYPAVMDALKLQIKAMPAGSLVVSHQFAFPGITPDEALKMQSTDSGETHTIYRYTTPLVPTADSEQRHLPR